MVAYDFRQQDTYWLAAYTSIDPFCVLCTCTRAAVASAFGRSQGGFLAPYQVFSSGRNPVAQRDIKAWPFEVSFLGFRDPLIRNTPARFS